MANKNFLTGKESLSIPLFVVIALVTGIVFFYSLMGDSGDGESGFSLKKEPSPLETGESFFVHEGRTFVAHDEPPVVASIYTASSCTSCAAEVGQIESKLRASIPTLSRIVIKDTDQTDTKQEAISLGVAYVPGIILSSDVSQTSFYSDGADFFQQKSDGSYQLYAHNLGNVPQRYIATPENKLGFSGKKEIANPASDEIHAFLTTDCASCKTAHDVLTLLEKSNPNVHIVRHYSESQQEKEHSATRAMACAASFEKEAAYTNTIYARQTAWKAVQDLDPVFTRYGAALGVDSPAFTACLNSPEASEAIQKQEKLFDTFGVTEVPLIFVGDQSFVGVQKAATLQAAIKKEVPTQQPVN